MAARLRPADPADVAAALARLGVGEPEKADLRLLTKHFMAILEDRAPGHSVEVRVPPYAAVQVDPRRPPHPRHPTRRDRDRRRHLDRARHRRPHLARGRAGGRVRASGERADLTAYLPLH